MKGLFELSHKIHHIKITNFPVPFKVFNGITLCNIGNYDHNVTDKNKQPIIIVMKIKTCFFSHDKTISRMFFIHVY